MRLLITPWYLPGLPILFWGLTKRQKVNITVDYVTTAEPAITRTVHLPRVVLTTLPLAVNVEDFFRGTR